MKRIAKILSFALIFGMVSAPAADARGRNNANNQRTSTPARPNNQGNRPAGNQGNRPAGNQGYRPNNNQGNKPGNPGFNQPGNRPNSNHGNKPGNPGYNQPGNRPGHAGPGFGPGPAGPGPRPSHFNQVPPRAPYRPYMPPPRPFRRPVPPPSFRPVGPVPVISTILGIALGSAINHSIAALINGGYYVSGYTNDAVYLNDVIQYNMLWPNATLYYGNRGLAASEFVYSTPYYDLNRYNATFGMLVRSYGSPISNVALAGGGTCVTWFGNHGQFISLQFAPGTAVDGGYRYFTTLTIGN